MRQKILFIIALLCAVTGAWARNGIYCTASDVGRVICTDGTIYDNVAAATAVGRTAVAKVIWIDETNKKGLALSLQDDGEKTSDFGTANSRCNDKNNSLPVDGATWKLASKDEWDKMIAGKPGALRDGFSSVGGQNMKSAYYYSSTQNKEYSSFTYVYHFGNNAWGYDKNGVLNRSCNVRACLAFNLLELYTIESESGWNDFCIKVNLGNTFSNLYVKLTTNISVSTMAGVDDGTSFQGIFDGDGKTITFTKGTSGSPFAGTGDEPNIDTYCAPFRHVKNAIIKNLHVDGTIYVSEKKAAGFVGESHGALTIINCRSSIAINSSKNGDGTSGGFVATLSGANNDILIDGCVFDGSFNTTNGTVGCGGFIGWGVYNKPTIKNSLMKPSSVAASMLGNTFARWYTGDNGIYEPTITNCYYVAVDNMPTNQGLGYSFASAPANIGTAGEAYTTSGITPYTSGLLYDGRYYMTPEAISLANTGTNDVVSIDGYFANVTLAGRTLYKDGAWNTICLPFNVDLTADGCPLAGATARTLTSASISGSTLNLTFGDAVSTLQAGTPYIIKWESGDDIVDPVFTGVTIDATDRSYDNGQSGDDRVRFLGTYKNLTFDASDYSILMMGGENNLYTPTTGANIGAQRAYFKIGEDGAKASTRIMSYSIGFSDGGTTGIIDIKDEAINIKNDTWFSLDGRRLQGKPTQKGVYINNGKKVVIK